MMKGNGCFLVAWSFVLVFSSAPATAAKYDPLAVAKGEVESILRTVNDEERKREIPLRVYFPIAKEPAPVVLFSHGLGGNRDGSAYLGKHWAGRGYVCVFLQHPGSDDSVWRDAPLAKRMAAMQEAASGENFRFRIEDVSAVIDQLDKWNETPEHALQGRMNLKQIGMSGHSFGAQTTQAVAGQWAPLIGQRFVDERIKAAVIMSPGSPRVGDVKAAFAKVKVPWLLLTGTKDTARIGGQTVESRLAVFPALPAGKHYELVLDNAEHSAFTDRALPGDREMRNPNHHKAILAISTAFWDAYLRGDKAAQAWLDGEGAANIVEPRDRWQKK